MGTRRRMPRTALLAPVLLVPLATLGTAALASNEIPDTYAGVTVVSLQTGSTMSVADDATINAAQEQGKNYYHFINVAAVLGSTRGNVANRTVTFAAGGAVICTVTTDADGSASCPNNTKVPTSAFIGGIPTTFTATFAGGGDLASSSASGRLREVGGP